MRQDGMRVRDEGLQVGVGGRRGRVVQRRVAPRVKLRLRQHQHPPHSILLNDLRTNHTQKKRMKITSRNNNNKKTKGGKSPDLTSKKTKQASI